MDSRQAKDFLVGQVAEQAVIEGVPLSDLEKRMMYFTEGPDAVEDAVQLNTEFEAQFATQEFETKISRLLHNAYRRARKENPDEVSRWDKCLRVLRKEDHYLLVLWDTNPPRPPYDQLKLLGTAILVVIVGGALIAGLMELTDRYHWHWPFGATTHSFMPLWLQRSLLALMVGGYIYYVVAPWLLGRRPIGIGELLQKLLGLISRGALRKAPPR